MKKMITKRSGARSGPRSSAHWKRRDVILLFERLGLYISAGLPIDRALSVAEEGSPEAKKRALREMRKDIESGVNVSAALMSRVRISETIAGLIRHGESSGKLRESFEAARGLLEREDELTKKCLSALAYPIVIAGFSLVLIIGLVRGVMPQIIPMLLSLHVKLPFLTRAVMMISGVLISYGWLILIAIAFCMCMFGIAYKKIFVIKGAVHILLGKIPLAGKLLGSYHISVFLRSCGALVESGVSGAESYSRTVKTISFIPIRRMLQAETGNVSRGVPLGTALNGKSLPAHVSPLIRAGEASGTLGSSILRASAIIDRDIEHALKRLTSLIEPVMMAGMGCVVGSIALSIMMPIYDISRVLQK